VSSSAWAICASGVVSRTQATVMWMTRT
jgi:hypothetical protein